MKRRQPSFKETLALQRRALRGDDDPADELLRLAFEVSPVRNPLALAADLFDETTNEGIE